VSRDSEVRRIPYVDLATQTAGIKAGLLRAIEDVLDSGKFILGPQVDAFEREFASVHGARFAVGVASGLDALTLSLCALGIGTGDEVITPANSFVGSTSCITLAGATPVFADVGDDYNIDPGSIERAITPRTRAIIPVHLTGRPARMDAIMEIALRRGLVVVEDAAQAVGAKLGGRSVGTFGRTGAFSLHPLKTLGACGDGGIVLTDDREIADRLRLLRNHGLRTREDCVEFAPNSRLDTLQAAILLAKLPYLEAWTNARRANVERYRRGLANVPGVTVPGDRDGEEAVYHTLVILANRREKLRAYLSERGIGTQVHYPVPIHLSTAAKSLGYCAGDFPKTEWQAQRILSVPVYHGLLPEDVDFVCRAIAAFYEAPPGETP
jgi:dTDP-4-amino-4,6-dideoxygalactose transaminase